MEKSFIIQKMTMLGFSEKNQQLPECKFSGRKGQPMYLFEMVIKHVQSFGPVMSLKGLGVHVAPTWLIM